MVISGEPLALFCKGECVTGEDVNCVDTGQR